MEFDDFQDELSTQLGGNLIDVELTPNDYLMAFNKAKRTFIQKGNNNLDHKFITLDVIGGTAAYTLDTADNIDTIVKVIKPRSALNTDDPISLSQWQILMDSTRGSGSGSGSLVTYELAQQYIENLDIYFAKEAQFIYQKRNDGLRFIDAPTVDEVWILEVYADLTDNEYRDVLWIQNWSLAEVKTMLGRAYSKFQSITTPTGETGLNGDQLLQEALAEKELLLDEIKNYTDGDPIGGMILIG